MWGYTADMIGLENSILISGGVMLATGVFGMLSPVSAIGKPTSSAEALEDPEVKLALTGRSGPIVVELEYRVSLDKARDFHNLMQEVQLSRKRNGAYGWSIARDVTDPELWTERYHCPTWHDYLRQRNRPTHAERELSRRAANFHTGPEPLRIRRMLERPFGSVRWRDDTPDRAAETVTPHHD